jgi:hypothetical protein
LDLRETLVIPSSEIFFEPLPLPITDLPTLLLRAEEMHVKHQNPQADLDCLNAILRLDLLNDVTKNKLVSHQK